MEPNPVAESEISTQEETAKDENGKPTPNPTIESILKHVSPTKEKVSIWGVPLLNDERSDVILLKFLLAREFKVKEAFTMLKNTISRRTPSSWKNQWLSSHTIYSSLQMLLSSKDSRETHLRLRPHFRLTQSSRCPLIDQIPPPKRGRGSSTLLSVPLILSIIHGSAGSCTTGSRSSKMDPILRWVDLPGFCIPVSLTSSCRRSCDAPKPGGPLTSRQPAEYKWMSGYPTPLQKIGQSLLCTGSSTQIKYLHEVCPKQSNIFNISNISKHMNNTATWAHERYSVYMPTIYPMVTRVQMFYSHTTYIKYSISNTCKHHQRQSHNPDFLLISVSRTSRLLARSLYL